jgi:hypothetical protein
MRRPTEAEAQPKPHHRRTKGEKANKKQMACVGAVYSIERVRSRQCHGFCGNRTIFYPKESSVPITTGPQA